MTRKDYVRLAEALLWARRRAEDGADRDALAAERLAGVDLALAEVADALASDNGRFDRQRFYRAAGADEAPGGLR